MTTPLDWQVSKNTMGRGGARTCAFVQGQNTRDTARARERSPPLAIPYPAAKPGNTGLSPHPVPSIVPNQCVQSLARHPRGRERAPPWGVSARAWTSDPTSDNRTKLSAPPAYRQPLTSPVNGGEEGGVMEGVAGGSSLGGVRGGTTTSDTPSLTPSGSLQGSPSCKPQGDL